MANAVDALTGIIPVVVAGGVAMSFMKNLPGLRQEGRRSSKRGKKKKTGRKGLGKGLNFGNFSNTDFSR